LRDQYKAGKLAAERYRSIFGKDNFFLELQVMGLWKQNHVNQLLLRMSRENRIDLVATMMCIIFMRRMRFLMMFYCVYRPIKKVSDKTG
jgi:DNA polymerase III alpha subunit